MAQRKNHSYYVGRAKRYPSPVLFPMGEGKILIMHQIFQFTPRTRAGRFGGVPDRQDGNRQKFLRDLRRLTDRLFFESSHPDGRQAKLVGSEHGKGTGDGSILDGIQLPTALAITRRGALGIGAEDQINRRLSEKLLPKSRLDQRLPLLEVSDHIDFIALQVASRGRQVGSSEDFLQFFRFN